MMRTKVRRLSVEQRRQCLKSRMVAMRERATTVESGRTYLAPPMAANPRARMMSGNFWKPRKRTREEVEGGVYQQRGHREGVLHKRGTESCFLVNVKADSTQGGEEEATNMTSNRGNLERDIA